MFRYTHYYYYFFFLWASHHTHTHIPYIAATSHIIVKYAVFRTHTFLLDCSPGVKQTFLSRLIELLITQSRCLCVCVYYWLQGAACRECGAGSSAWIEGPRATAPSPGVSAALSPNPSARTSTWAQRYAHVSRQRPGHVSLPPKAHISVSTLKKDLAWQGR